MKRKLYFDNKRFIQTNSNNNNIRDIESLEQKKYLRYKSKEGYTNEIAKVYEINTHGKFTIIVRSSFLRLPVHSTTNINPCYSSKCDSEVFLQSDLNNNHYLVRDRKRKKWKSLHGKLVKSIEKGESSTVIVHACMFNQ
jgi:hypothetical protein